MKVYIVLRGENSEGGSIVAVYADEQQAIECVLEEKCHFPGGWKRDGTLRCFQNGIDWVSVEEYTVRS